MNKLIQIGSFLVASFISISSFAQISSTMETSLDQTLDSMKTVLNTKSLSAAIQTADGSMWAHAIGNSGTFSQVTTSDSYLIGSVTKTLLSACVLDLVDDGLIALDDSIHEFLPTMLNIDSSITIRQLLNHSSGIFDALAHPHQPDSMNADFSRIWTPEELIQDFVSAPNFAAGTSWSYSNTNYFLLGMIIQEVTGNPFYTELRNRFYTPLGLTSFCFPTYESNLGPVAHVWIDLNGDGVLDDAHNFYMNYVSLNSTAGAAGGYYSTPSDCAKWMRAYQRGDVVSASSLAEAQTVINAPGAQGNLYGLGLMKNTTHFLGHLAYGHGGDLAYHASSWYFPEFDISITVFNNDNSKTSWNLLPVVRELLKSFLTNQAASLNENTLDKTKVHPNPFTSEITINLPADFGKNLTKINLYDAEGNNIAKEVSLVENENEYILTLKNLDALPAGMYFVNLIGQDGISKLIKVIK